LYTQHQATFCKLLKDTYLYQIHSLENLCYRRVRRYGDQVKDFLFRFSSLQPDKIYWTPCRPPAN
jgi:hypothetical protein